MKADIKYKLKQWDGIHIEYLTKIYKANASSPLFFKNIVALCIKDQELQKATTWLIKHHYDNGQTLPRLLTEKLVMACNEFQNWEEKLHLLQIFPKFNLTESSVMIMEKFTRNCLTDNNKFVKAWAYNGLYELTKHIPELKTELAFICERAMETESAAIKSKIKKILLALNKKRLP